MKQISPDIEQWLLQDTHVVSRWRNLARHLGLTECLLETEFVGGARRRGWREKDKLQMLMRTWKKKNPDSYNIHTLKSILLAEGLYDMWMWMNIITQDTKRPDSRRTSPPPATSPTPSSPWSRYLYSPSPSPPYSFTSQSSYPESDYPHSLSSKGSRPVSQLSDYRANTSSSPHLLASFSTTSSSLLYRPDLIQLSSPRRWIRQKGEGRARHSSSESGRDMSATSDKWDSLEIIEHKNNPTVNYFYNNEHIDDQTKHAESEDDSSKLADQSSILLKIKECARNNDLDVINRVNKMNEELIVDTKPYTSIIKIDKNKKHESKRKRVKFDEEDPCEKQIDFLLDMIEQSLNDLNVKN